MKQAYKRESLRTGVDWSGRLFAVDGTDTVNQALSAAATCLYGVAYSAIVAVGASPDLGFVHRGNDRSFVYDIADLFREEIALPVAFDVAAAGDTDVQGRTRRAMRDRIRSTRIMPRCVDSVISLLLACNEADALIHSMDSTNPTPLTEGEDK